MTTTFPNISARLHRIAQELAEIQAALAGAARGQIWKPGPRAIVALEKTKALIQAKGGAAHWSDCAWELVDAKTFGRSAAYEHLRKLVKHGYLRADPLRQKLSLPSDAPTKTAADLL